MLYGEIIAVCYEIRTKHIKALCGQKVEFVNVKPGGTSSNHWAVKRKYDVEEPHNVKMSLFTPMQVRGKGEM